MDLLVLPIALSLAGSVGLLTFVAYQRLVARSRIVAAPSGVARTRAGNDASSALLQQRRNIPFTNLLPLSQVSEERMGRQLAQAGWRFRVNEYLSLRLASGIFGAAAGVLLMFSLHPESGLLSATLRAWLFPMFIIWFMAPRDFRIM